MKSGNPFDVMPPAKKYSRQRHDNPFLGGLTTGIVPFAKDSAIRGIGGAGGMIVAKMIVQKGLGRVLPSMTSGTLGMITETAIALFLGKFVSGKHLGGFGRRAGEGIGTVAMSNLVMSTVGKQLGLSDEITLEDLGISEGAMRTANGALSDAYDTAQSALQGTETVVADTPLFNGLFGTETVVADTPIFQ